ncbi:hypothetical protein GCM10027276_08480 [Comamonas piscis]
MYMNKNALLYDNLTADEMNILLSELKDRFPDIAVATQHQKDWQLSYQEAMDYIDSVDKDYDSPNYLRENCPSEPMVTCLRHRPVHEMFNLFESADLMG